MQFRTKAMARAIAAAIATGALFGVSGAQAGGIITTWDGGPAENGGEIIAAGNRAVYDQAMAILKA